MTKVVVCGLPRSGNRLIARMLERHDLVAEIRHYGSAHPFKIGGGPTHAVMPLRDSACQERSLASAPAPPGAPDGTAPTGRIQTQLRHFYPTLRWLASFDVPLLPVCYEDLVVRPEGEGRRILEFCAPGVEWQGWGEEIVDGNEKWRGK